MWKIAKLAAHLDHALTVIIAPDGGASITFTNEYLRIQHVFEMGSFPLRTMKAASLETALQMFLTYISDATLHWSDPDTAEEKELRVKIPGDLLEEKVPA